MKLWHDDIRRPPDESWVWARTNEQAQAILTENEVQEASLDHDLGLEWADPDAPGAIAFAGASPVGSGVDLVKWMVEHNRVPPKVTVHSWNPDGADRMAAYLNDAGYDCKVSIYIPGFDRLGGRKSG